MTGKFPTETADDLVTAGTLPVLFLPFLLSLAGQGGMLKMLCLTACVLALLLSVQPYAAVLPWTLGMAIAVIAIRERIHQLRAAGVRRLK